RGGLPELTLAIEHVEMGVGHRHLRLDSCCSKVPRRRVAAKFRQPRTSTISGSGATASRGEQNSSAAVRPSLTSPAPARSRSASGRTWSMNDKVNLAEKFARLERPYEPGI